MTINWQEPTWRPGVYYIKTYEPIHNGYRDGVLFEQLTENKLFLDEYEDFFLEWRKNVVRLPWQKELRLITWEICLYCYDGLLASYVSKQDFLSTIDPSLSVESRLESLDKILIYFQNKLPLFVEALNMDMRRYSKEYANWLAELVHGNTKNSQS
ncbi:MAG: hypothetical protein M0R80_01545 [Proteobacteria bacterium]|nr:hypothetical protein [Pseudomonadota bacterium]